MQQVISLNYLQNLSGFDFSLAFLGAVLLGTSKAGLKGIGIAIVTIMAVVFGGKPSTRILIPLMVLADSLAVIYYSRYTQWIYLKKLLPTMVIGVLLGVWLGNDISDAFFKQLMAMLILLIVLSMIYFEKRKLKEIPKSKLFSNSMGLLSGFTSMIGNLAGSFSNIYFLAMRLPKNAFIGTAAWLFFIINVFKLPFHIFVWKTISKETLALNIVLIPGVLIGFFTGIYLVKLFSNDSYRKFILFVTAIGAVILLFK